MPVGTAKPGAPPTAAPVGPSSLEWEPCGQRLQCATLTVPKDYDDPGKGAIDLFVERRPATSSTARIGSLLVNPGGPGVPGSYMVQQAAGYFSSTLLDRFDVVGWDPRGTGRSDPIVCTDDLDAWMALDPTPDTPAEHVALVAASKAFGAQCQARAGDLLAQVSTYDSAHDMDEIRRALGEDKISYLGASYGSQLGATWATLFPSTVRAAVLDGATNVNADQFTKQREQAVALEHSLDDALAACKADAKCPFHGGGDPGAAFDALWAKIDESPVPVKGVPGAVPVGQGVAFYGVVSQLYDTTYRPQLYRALAALERRDGRPMFELYRSYQTSGGRFPHEVDALQAISCVDDPGPTDIAEIDQRAAQLKALAPRLGEALGTGYVCATWPAPPRPVTVTGRGAGPILVVGTTGDPITPLTSSTALAASLEQGRLLTVEGDRHTGYDLNACATATIDRYLTDLAVPAAGTVCR
jgi:pimeloyl-ACP methyl ester carboxylesterase